MKNKWIEMHDDNKEQITLLLERKDLFQVVIEGKKIQTKNTFMEEVGKALFFPGECRGKYARFEDFIRDLLWIPEGQGICIRITDYQQFLGDDERNKRIIEEIMQDEVLPFWETKVVKQVKGGKPREFYVIVS